MDTKELIESIARVKNAYEKATNESIKAKFGAKLQELEAKLAKAEAEVEKKEEKAIAQEEKKLSESEEKIKKLEAALTKNLNPQIRAKFEKTLAELKGENKEIKAQIKEDKKEIAEEKKELKKAVKEVKSAEKEVRKAAVKKVATIKKVRSKRATKKAVRSKKISKIMTDLDELIAKNKKLKSKYGGKDVDLERDSKRKAKPFGYRFVGKHDYRVPTEAQIRRGLKRGTIDYEARPNRADINPDKKVKLADGGMMADGGDMMARGGRTKAALTADKRYKALKAGKRISEDGNVYYESRPNRSDVSRRDRLEDGGETNFNINDDLYKAVLDMDEFEYSNFAYEHDIDTDDAQQMEDFIYDAKAYDAKKMLDEIKDGQYRGYARGGKVKRTKAAIAADKRYKALKAGKRISEDGNVYYESRENRSDANRKLKLKKGGKVGTSKEDRARFAKPAGWRWKEEAVTKRVIERKQLSMQPSKKMRDKYPDLVYYEDRLNKADKKPTRTSADSI